MNFLMRNMNEVAASPVFASLYQSEALTKEIMIMACKSKRPRQS